MTFHEALSGLQPRTWIHLLSLLIGVFTLSIVAVEFWLEHLRPAKSNVRLNVIDTANNTIRHQAEFDQVFFRSRIMATNEGNRDARIANRGTLLEGVFRGGSGTHRVEPPDCGGAQVNVALIDKDGRRVEPGESIPLRIDIRYRNDHGICDFINENDKTTMIGTIQIEDPKITYTVDFEESFDIAGTTLRP